MPEAAWKRTERRHADMFHCGARLGPTGHNFPDSVSAVLAVESKHTESLPRWLREAMDQAVGNEVSFRGGHPPRLSIVAVHESGRKYEDDLVVMETTAFVEWVLPLLEGERERSKMLGLGNGQEMPHSSLPVSR